MVRALLLWMVLNCTWLIGCTNRLVALYLCRFYEVINWGEEIWACGVCFLRHGSGEKNVERGGNVMLL